jgi:hypothetical protein
VDPREVEGFGVYSDAGDRQREREDGEAVQLVRQARAVGENRALLDDAGQRRVRGDAKRHPPEKHEARVDGKQRHVFGRVRELRRQAVQPQARVLVAEEHEAVAHRGQTQNDRQRAGRAHELVVRRLGGGGFGFATASAGGGRRRSRRLRGLAGDRARLATGRDHRGRRPEAPGRDGGAHRRARVRSGSSAPIDRTLAFRKRKR